MSEEETLETRARSYSKSENKMASRKKKNKTEVNTKEEDPMNSEEGNASPFKNFKKPSTEDDWWRMFVDIQTTLKSIKKELAQSQQLRGKVETFSDSWKQKCG